MSFKYQIVRKFFTLSFNLQQHAAKLHTKIGNWFAKIDYATHGEEVILDEEAESIYSLVAEMLSAYYSNNYLLDEVDLDYLSQFYNDKLSIDQVDIAMLASILNEALAKNEYKFSKKSQEVIERVRSSIG